MAERGVMLGGLCERPQLLADEIVKRAPRPEAPFNGLRRAALLDHTLSKRMIEELYRRGHRVQSWVECSRENHLSALIDSVKGGSPF